MNESMLQFQDLTRQLDVLKNLKIKVENGEKNDISKEELDNQIQKLKKELPSTDSLPEDLKIINFLKTQIEGEYIKVENSNHDWKNVFFGDSYLTKMIDSEKYSDYAAWTEFLIDSYQKGNISYSSLIKAGYNPELELSYYLNHEKHIDNQPTFREIVAVAPRENVYAVFEIQKHSFPNLYLVDQNGNKIRELEAEKYNLYKEGNYFFKNEHFPNGLDDYRLEILAEDNQEYSFTSNVKNIQNKEHILSTLEQNSDYWIIEFNENGGDMPDFSGQRLTKETIEKIMRYEAPISYSDGYYKFFIKHYKNEKVIEDIRLDVGDGMLTNRETYNYLFSEVAKIDEKRKVFAAETDENISVQTTPLNLNKKEEVETKVIKESTINVQTSLEEYKNLTARIVELERTIDYGDGTVEELNDLRNRAASVLTAEQKEHIIEFLKTQSSGEHIKLFASEDGASDEIFFGHTFIDKKVDLLEEKRYRTWSNLLLSHFETTPYTINYVDLENAGYDPNVDINYYKNHKENIDNQETYKQIVAVDNQKGVALQYSIQKYQLPEFNIIDKSGKIVKEETLEEVLTDNRNYFFNKEGFEPVDDYELDEFNKKNKEYLFTNNEEEITKFYAELTVNENENVPVVPSNEQINTMTLQKLNNDIKNYLSSTEKDKSILHEKDVKKHIEYMQKLFDSLENKPGFITQNKIDSYAAELGVMDLTTAIKNDNKKAIKEILAAGIKEYLQSDTYKNFLNFASSMHQYSQKNLRLILSQYPNASLIASHTDWKAKGRYINKGSKAIRVYAPIFGYKKDEEGNFIKDEKGRKIPTGEIVAWRLAPVFDVSQTNGKEIPKQLYELTENFKSPEAFTSIFNAVKKCTTATVSFGDMNLSPGARGYYIPATHEIVIKKGMSTYHTLKTEIHEVVHSVLHNKQNEFISAAQMEFEAESVAYIVCNHFGVDTSDYSFGYLSSWTEAGSKLEEFEQSLATICNTAKSLITQIEKEINQELNIKENKVQEKLNPYQEKIRKAQEQLKAQLENKTEQNNLVKK